MHQGQPGMNFESEQQQAESVDGFLRAENVWELPVTWYLTNCLKELSFAHPLEERRLICAIPILHPEKHTSIWIAVGEELEIYVPSDWKVVFKCNAFFGGCDDKRWQNGNINKESVLVIRGTLSFRRLGG